MTAFSAMAAVAQADSAFATIIDMNKDSAVAVVRGHRQGWIKQFRPDALDVSELKVGDTLRVSWEIGQVSSFKGNPRRYPLLPVAVKDPCCDVVEVKAGVGGVSEVLAKTVTGEPLRFMVTDTLASQIFTGQKVYTQPSHGYAMLLIGRDSTRLPLYGFPLLQQ